MAEITVSSWRITQAQPTGMMMWFDPEREVPLLRTASVLEREELGYYEGGALDGTVSRTEGSAEVGGDAPEDPSVDEDDDLPF